MRKIKKGTFLGILAIGLIGLSMIAFAEEETTEHVFVYADESDEEGDDSADNPPMRGEANTTPTWGRTKEVEDMLKEWQEEEEAKKATRTYRDTGRVSFICRANADYIPTDCILITLIDEYDDFQYVAIERERGFSTTEDLPAGRYMLNGASSWDREKDTNIGQSGKWIVKAHTLDDNDSLIDGNMITIEEGSDNMVVEVYTDNDTQTYIPKIEDAVTATESNANDDSFDISKYLAPIIGVIIVVGALVAREAKKWKTKAKKN